MKTPNWTAIMGALVGLLVLSIAILLLNRKDLESFPTIESTAPSGTSIFAQLLKDAGYTVVIDRQEIPLLEPSDVAVAFWHPDSSWAGEWSDAGKETVVSVIDEHPRRGGIVFSFDIPLDFNTTSQAVRGAKNITVLSRFEPAQVKYSISPPMPKPEEASDESTDFYGVPSGEYTATFVDNAAAEYVRVEPKGLGYEITTNAGMLATNRFIDKNDHAKFLLHLFHAYVPLDRRIVFTEASFGNVDKSGIASAIGPWMSSIQLQLAVLFIVVCLSLGRQFGVPQTFRRVQFGAREMVDALGDTLQNSQQTDLSIRLIAANANLRVKRAIGLPLSASAVERDSKLPIEIRNALFVLENRIEAGTTEKDAVHLIRTQLTIIESWLEGHGDRRKSMRRRG